MSTMAATSGRTGRNDEGRKFRHFRFLARHGVRVVRLLSLRLARRHHRHAVLLGRIRRQRATSSRCSPSPPASSCARSARSCSAASATSSAANTPSSSPSLIMGLSTFIVGLLPSSATDRHRGAGHPDRAAPAAGPRARRRVWRRGDLRGRACAAGQARLLHLVDPDHGDARPVPVAAGDPVHPHRDGRSLNSRAWGWRIPFLVSSPARHLGLDPACA